MKKVLIGNGGHAKEVMAQMGVKLIRFVDDKYIDDETLPLSQFDIKVLNVGCVSKCSILVLSFL